MREAPRGGNRPCEKKRGEEEEGEEEKEEEEEEDDGNDNEDEDNEEEVGDDEEAEEEVEVVYIYGERLLVVGQNVGEEPRARQREERRDETGCSSFARLAPRSLRSTLSLKARGRFSEATGAGGIRVELDYTAKGYIYRARMYAEARTSPQRGRPCGFSLDATSRVDSRFRIHRIRADAA